MEGKYGPGGKASPGKKGETKTTLQHVKENKIENSTSKVDQDAGGSETKLTY